VKTNKILKVVCTIVAIIILIMVSFVGIYVMDNGRLVNVQKDMTKGMEFGMEREYVFSVSESVIKEYYDKDGKLVPNEDVDQNAEEGTYETKDVNINSDEIKTVENYQLVKGLMEKRIKDLGLEEYRLTLDEESGDIVLKTNESYQTDRVLYAIYGEGEFLLKDAETDEVLLNNTDIKEAVVGYNTTDAGTRVSLIIQLNKEGKEKFESITSNYVKTTETTDVTAEDGTVSQEEKVVEKKVKLYVDGEMIDEISFEEPIKNGQLQLSMGAAVADEEELQELFTTASIEATKLTYGPTPVIYDVAQSTNILSNYDRDTIVSWEAIGIILLTFVLIYFVIRFKERAIIAGILFMGFTALFLLAMRYANVAVTAASTVGFTFIEAFVLVFIDKLLRKLKKYDINEDTPKSIIDKFIFKSIMVLLPIFIIAVVFSMFTPLALNSLGIVLFWGIILFIIYSYIFGKTLLLNFEYLFENK